MINERSCGERSGLSSRGAMLQPVRKTDKDNIRKSRAAAVAHRNTGFVKRGTKRDSKDFENRDVNLLN